MVVNKEYIRKISSIRYRLNTSDMTRSKNKDNEA